MPVTAESKDRATPMPYNPNSQQQGRPMAHLRDSFWVQEPRQRSVLCSNGKQTLSKGTVGR